MEDFRKKLEVLVEDKIELALFKSHMRTFKPIVFEGVSLSIQASTFHHSEPRETLTDLKKYTAFEVAILDNETKRFINPREDKRLKDFIFIRLLMKHKCGPIFSYVPTSIVQSLYNYLVKNQVKVLN